MRNIGWKYESARHSLAARGIKTGRSYMRWKPGAHAQGRGSVLPNFLVWQSPSKDAEDAKRRLDEDKAWILISASARDREGLKHTLSKFREYKEKQEAVNRIIARDAHLEFHDPTVPARISTIFEEVERAHIPRTREDEFYPSDFELDRLKSEQRRLFNSPGTNFDLEKYLEANSKVEGKTLEEWDKWDRMNGGVE